MNLPARHFVHSIEELRSVFVQTSKIPLARPLTIEVSYATPKPSQGQQGLWHQLVGIFAEHSGNTFEEMKRILLRECVEPVTVTFNGKEYNRARRWTELTPQQATNLITQTYALGADLGIELPHPEDREQNHYAQEAN